MPRYHYSRIAPHSATTSSESFFRRQNSNGQSKPSATTLTSNNNNNNHFSLGTFKSTFTPLITHSRTMPAHRREFVQIPVTRDDGTSTSNGSIHSIPVTLLGETTQISPNTNDSNRNQSPRPHYTHLLRPSSKYSQNVSNSNAEESDTNIPRLPSVSRRFNVTTPVLATSPAIVTPTVGTATTTTDDEDDTIKQNISPPSARRIPIRFGQAPNVASIPTNSSRISSAVLRSSPLSHSLSNQLQRQKTDLNDTSLSSDFTAVGSNTSSSRRAEAMAREAIQGIVRFQQQHSNHSLPENNNIFIRSPVLSRRVIVNLKNNQSVSLDSRLLSAHTPPTRTASGLSCSRISPKNNLYHIPSLHEVQLPSQTASIISDNSVQSSQSPSHTNSNTSNYKNEFRMEIPITIITKDDQENRMELNDRQEDGIVNFNQHRTIVNELIPSSNTNQTLKSILKRSTSRETVSRKNVSFMNA